MQYGEPGFRDLPPLPPQIEDTPVWRILPYDIPGVDQMGLYDAPTTARALGYGRGLPPDVANQWIEDNVRLRDIVGAAAKVARAPQEYPEVHPSVIRAVAGNLRSALLERDATGSGRLESEYFRSDARTLFSMYDTLLNPRESAARARTDQQHGSAANVTHHPRDQRMGKHAAVHGSIGDQAVSDARPGRSSERYENTRNPSWYEKSSREAKRILASINPETLMRLSDTLTNADITAIGFSGKKVKKDRMPGEHTYMELPGEFNHHRLQKLQVDNTGGYSTRTEPETLHGGVHPLEDWLEQEGSNWLSVIMRQAKDDDQIDRRANHFLWHHNVTVGGEKREWIMLSSYVSGQAGDMDGTEEGLRTRAIEVRQGVAAEIEQIIKDDPIAYMALQFMLAPGLDRGPSKDPYAPGLVIEPSRSVTIIRPQFLRTIRSIRADGHHLRVYNIYSQSFFETTFDERWRSQTVEYMYDRSRAA